MQIGRRKIELKEGVRELDRWIHELRFFHDSGVERTVVMEKKLAYIAAIISLLNTITWEQVVEW